MAERKTLQDFERACQQAANEARCEQIALAARDFLIKTLVPPTVAEQINQQLAQESFSSAEAAPLPEAELELNRAAGAQLEARLADFLPSIFHLSKSFDQSVVYLLLARARTICQKIDDWHQYNYWTPLFDFLKSADPETWRRWRTAFLSQQLARAEVRHGDFNLAKLYAIYGLQNLAEIPDRRLYLDLCSRLENAMSEGDGSFNVAFALGQRRCQCLLLTAEARIQTNELPLACVTLEEAEQLSQSLDSPRLRVQKLFTEALLHQKRNELGEAKAKLQQALQIGYDHGFGDAERQFDLIRQAIYN